MKLVAIIVAVLLAAPLWAVVPMPVPEVRPTIRVTVEGFVSVNRGWNWAGEQSAVDIERDLETKYDRPLARLAFSDDCTYREAIRNDGFVVRVEGVEVVRGSERFIVAESVRTVAIQER